MTSYLAPAPSHRFFADLFCADADCVFYWEHENFSVADLAGLGCSDHHADSFFHHVVREHDFHLHFGQKIHSVFAPAINLGVSFLPAKPLYFGDRHPFDAKLGQCLFDLLELERFDDGFQFFHVKVNSASRGTLQSKATRSTRSLSNAAMRMQSRIFAQLLHDNDARQPGLVAVTAAPRIRRPSTRANWHVPFFCWLPHFDRDEMLGKFAKFF